MTGWLTQNLGWKAVSLVLATFFWIFVSNEPELATFQSVPVQYKAVPDDLEIASSVVETVRLEMRGPSGRLRDVLDARLAAMLDFSGVHRAGEQTFAIDESNVALPRGIRLVRAIPAQLRFQLERRVTRQVPVEARFAGGPAQGYVLAESHVRPQTVTVVGPESFVSKIASVRTDPVDISSVVATSQFQAHTFSSEAQVRIQAPSTVTVEVVVRKR